MPTTQAMLKADLIREQIAFLKEKREVLGHSVEHSRYKEYDRGQFELCSELIDRLENELKSLGV